MELRPKWHYSWFCPTSRSLTTPVKVYAMATHLELSFIPFFSYRCVRRALPTLAAGISNRKRPRIEVSRIHQHSIGQLQPRSLLSAINAIASSHRAWEYPAAVVRRGEIQNDEVLCCTLVFDSQVQIQKKIISRRYFASVSAISYAIFLVMFGLIAFIGGAVTDQHPVPEVIFRTNIMSFDSRFLFTHRYSASSCWRSDFVTSCFWLSTFVFMCSGPKKQSRTRRTE